MKTILLLLLIVTSYIGFAQDTINRNDYIRIDDTVYYNAKAYTGVAVKKDANGSIVSLEQYRDGVAHGIWEEWYPTGEKQAQMTIEYGVPNGYYILWDTKGNIISKHKFVNGEIEDE